MTTDVVHKDTSLLVLPWLIVNCFHRRFLFSIDFFFLAHLSEMLTITLTQSRYRSCAAIVERQLVDNVVESWKIKATLQIKSGSFLLLAERVITRL